MNSTYGKATSCRSFGWLGPSVPYTAVSTRLSWPFLPRPEHLKSFPEFPKTDEVMIREAIICQLAKAKGKVTRHFFMKGLIILAHYQITKQFFDEHKLTQQEIELILQQLE